MKRERGRERSYSGEKKGLGRKEDLLSSSQNHLPLAVCLSFPQAQTCLSLLCNILRLPYGPTTTSSPFLRFGGLREHTYLHFHITCSSRSLCNIAILEKLLFKEIVLAFLSCHLLFLTLTRTRSICSSLAHLCVSK